MNSIHTQRFKIKKDIHSKILPDRRSTSDTSIISFHSNSILMAPGRYKLTSNHRCVESRLCPFNALVKEEKRRGRRSEELIITPHEIETERE